MIDARGWLPAFDCSRQYTAAWCDGAHVPLRCTRITESKSSSVIEKIMRSRRIPALFTSTSSLPNVSIAWWTMARAPSKSATSS